MRMNYLYTFFTLLLFLSCDRKIDPEIEKKSILKVMDNQQTAWNNADIQTYMEGYWKSDSLKFIGSKGIRYGWMSTLDGYINSYPNAEVMGKLSFSDIQVDILSDSSAFVIGRWYLKRAKDEISGFYTLLWRKINGEWKIVVDHSS